MKLTFSFLKKFKYQLIYIVIGEPTNDIVLIKLFIPI